MKTPASALDFNTIDFNNIQWSQLSPETLAEACLRLSEWLQAVCCTQPEDFSHGVSARGEALQELARRPQAQQALLANNPHWQALLQLEPQLLATATAQGERLRQSYQQAKNNQQAVSGYRHSNLLP